jgi:hypothetical protein
MFDPGGACRAAIAVKVSSPVHHGALSRLEHRFSQEGAQGLFMANID